MRSFMIEAKPGVNRDDLTYLCRRWVVGLKKGRRYRYRFVLVRGSDSLATGGLRQHGQTKKAV